jgi:hypothetical protein
MISKWRGHNKKDARYQGIPERVLNAISAQQDASEKLVGWVQMAVVIFFGVSRHPYSALSGLSVSDVRAFALPFDYHRYEPPAGDDLVVSLAVSATALVLFEITDAAICFHFYCLARLAF